MRTPPTPAFPFPNDIGKSQGNSAIGDHNTQYNISPSVTIIHGKHTFEAGVQWELGLDNYYQTNIASGAFGFSGAWTANLAESKPRQWLRVCGFLAGFGQPGPATFVNQTEGSAQVPAQTAGRQTYRGFYGADTWHVSPKLTLNLGLRYELAGPGRPLQPPELLESDVDECDRHRLQRYSRNSLHRRCPGRRSPNSSRNNIAVGQT